MNIVIFRCELGQKILEVFTTKSLLRTIFTIGFFNKRIELFSRHTD